MFQIFSIIGATPPQETGLIVNSWYGKFHHEMRWWHQSHFALWDRVDLSRRAEIWYLESLRNASASASNQGYDGARWFKMTGPVLNRSHANGLDAPAVGNTTYSHDTRLAPLLVWEGPSSTGPLLIWQQPHPIWMLDMQRKVAATTPACPLTPRATRVCCVCVCVCVLWQGDRRRSQRDPAR